MSKYKFIRIEEEVHEKLLEISTADNRSMSSMAEVLIMREWDRINKPTVGSESVVLTQSTTD